MTLRERVLATLSGHVPDAIPWFADLRYYFHAHHDPELNRNPEQYDEGLCLLHRTLSVGFYHFAPLWREVHEGTTTETRREAELNVTTIRTTKGTLTMRRRRLAGAWCQATVEHFVKGPEDFAILREYIATTQYLPAPERYERQVKLCGDLAMPRAHLPKSGFQKLIEPYAGVETVVYTLADAPEEVELTAKAFEQADEAAERIANKYDAAMAFFADNLTSEITSPRLFQRFLTPRYKRAIPKFHETGKVCGVHVDGTMRGILSLLVDAGMDCIESVTPAPVGDLSLEQVFEQVSDETIIWGGVPGAMFSPTYPREDFEHHVLKMIRLGKERGRFVLGSADQVPPDGDLNRVRWISDTIEREGRTR